MVLMFLLKIRLNLYEEDIADHFGVHVSTVSRNFHRVLDVLYVYTPDFIRWPDRYTSSDNAVKFSKIFTKIARIIDCSEIFIERPSDLLARAKLE